VNCARPGCTGQIVDGYCDVCGMAPARSESPAPASSDAVPGVPSSTQPATSHTSARRSTTGRRHSSTRGRLGAGLVEIPPVPFRDPRDAVMADPKVAESRRFCSRCDSPVGRGREGEPGRTEGFCRKCGAPFSFHPKLRSGDVLAGQYEVVGCLAHGGMGWVYLAKDRNVSDRWVVLKGLLNTGDDDAMAAALSERRFLAEVEHPNVVKIFNFVQHESSGYIVMEYVGGTSLKQMLAARREANGGEPDPLPVAQAIAYMLEILPALGYLHQLGLLFCDFKPDNVIQTQHSLKLIDLGGVYRIDEPASAIFGTVGFQAPEIAADGPSIASDLFTVARTLAVLCIDFRGYQGALKFTLPAQDSVEVFARYESLYRFLLKGTAPNPDDRFQTAEEMGEQLYGVLREVVAREEGRPVPAPSTLFTPALRAGTERPDWRILPRPQVASDDPGVGYLATLPAGEPLQMVAQLRAAPARTVEVELRLASALIEVGDWPGVEEVLTKVEADDPWEWRTSWYRGIAELAREQFSEAAASFAIVYRSLPGELAPKLALGLAYESGDQFVDAAPWYDTVSRTDPAYTSAAFGLARCRLAERDAPGAIEAYDRVPDSSSAYVDAQIARIRCLAGPNRPGEATLDELLEAGSALDDLTLDGQQRAKLTSELLEGALRLVRTGRANDRADRMVLGHPVVERELRFGLEDSYRTLARLATARAERIRLVDQANAVRPRTWV
jgi:serine/threonine-protein kinase PknG